MRTSLSILPVLAALLFAPPLAAQRVETISTGAPLNGPDGAAVDRAGRIYIANWGRGDGTTVVRMDSAGTPQPFMDGFRAPDGLAFDRRGNLYVSNFASGTIERITPAGTRSVFASGLNRPSALAFDRRGNLYVSNFGNYDGTIVSRISPDGSVRPFATGFNAPLGLAFGPDGDLYVSNFGSGLIHRVAPDGTPRVHATIPNETPARLQYLAFDPCGTLYVPSYGHNVVYAVGPEGDVRVFAGSGRKGSADGAADEAEFDGPNSIVRTAGGDLIVTEFNANRARRIRMDASASCKPRR